jgi:hypothetical protein
LSQRRDNSTARYAESSTCTSENAVKANFHEKAHFVKGRRGGPFEVERNGCVSFALCFHPHF